MTKTILITGCSSGIGLAAARLLRERGWRVFACARRPEDVARLEAEGFESFALEVTDAAAREAVMAAVLARCGEEGLFALFNNAGYGQPGAVEDLPEAALREQLETNLIAPHALARLALPGMIARGRGRIIQNSSVLGFVSMRFRGAYNASKHALEGLTDTLRLELAGTGVHAVLIEPGPIESRFRQHALAAFERHVDWRSSRHHGMYQTLLDRFRSSEHGAFTLPPQAVAACVLRALESPRPRVCYRVTLPTHLFALLKRLLSRRALDHILELSGSGITHPRAPFAAAPKESP